MRTKSLSDFKLFRNWVLEMDTIFIQAHFHLAWYTVLHLRKAGWSMRVPFKSDLDIPKSVLRAAGNIVRNQAPDSYMLTGLAWARPGEKADKKVFSHWEYYRRGPEILMFTGKTIDNKETENAVFKVIRRASNITSEIVEFEQIDTVAIDAHGFHLR